MLAGAVSGPEIVLDLRDYESLLEYMADVPAPRRRCGIRHRLAVVLAFAVVAVMAQADSVTAIAEWAGDVPAEVLQALGARRDRRGRLIPPSLPTFRRVLRNLDGQALAAAFGAWLTAQVLAGLDTAPLVIALDGKTVRGAKGKDGKSPHLLAAMITGARAVIAQKDIDAKTNEITQVRPLLDDLDIAGALVTADALHVQKDTARYLVQDKQAGYLFTAVKDNQPSLFDTLDALDWENTPVTHVMRDKATGGTRPAPFRSCPSRTACSRTPPRPASSSGTSATRAPANSAPPSPPSPSPAGPRPAAGRRRHSPAPPAATGRSRPCTTSVTSS